MQDIDILADILNLDQSNQCSFPVGFNLYTTNCDHGKKLWIIIIVTIMMLIIIIFVNNDNNYNNAFYLHYPFAAQGITHCYRV